MASQEQIDRFLADPERKLPRAPGHERKEPSAKEDVRKRSGGKALQRRQPIRRGRPKEVPDERRGFWHGVMCTKLRTQEAREGFDGFLQVRMWSARLRGSDRGL